MYLHNNRLYSNSEFPFQLWGRPSNLDVYCSIWLCLHKTEFKKNIKPTTHKTNQPNKPEYSSPVYLLVCRETTRVLQTHFRKRLWVVGHLQGYSTSHGSRRRWKIYKQTCGEREIGQVFCEGWVPNHIGHRQTLNFYQQKRMHQLLFPAVISVVSWQKCRGKTWRAFLLRLWRNRVPVCDSNMAQMMVSELQFHIMNTCSLVC